MTKFVKSQYIFIVYRKIFYNLQKKKVLIPSKLLYKKHYLQNAPWLINVFFVVSNTLNASSNVSPAFKSSD